MVEGIRIIKGTDSDLKSWLMGIQVKQSIPLVEAQDSLTF